MDHTNTTVFRQWKYGCVHLVDVVSFRLERRRAGCGFVDAERMRELLAVVGTANQKPSLALQTLGPEDERDEVKATRAR